METRERIVLAAHELFLDHGYFPTTVCAIADAAGVAEKTVYLAFSDKAAILDAVIDAAISGTDPSPRPQATQDRPPSQDAWGGILRDFSHTAAGIMQRTARVLAMAEAAATIDPALADFRARGHGAMRQRFEGVAAALDARRALARGVSESRAAATIYAVANEAVYIRLIDGYGWSSQDYALWLEHVLTAALTERTVKRRNRSNGP